MALKNIIDTDVLVVKPSDNNRIGDFGSKIGGARKDVYVARGGLNLNDLDSMDEREYEKHLKKDNVWVKPDYAKMLEEGYASVCIYYIKKLRDALPSKPVDKSYNHAKVYIRLLNIYKAVSSDLKTPSSLYNVWAKVEKEANNAGFEYIKSRTYKKAIEVARVSMSDIKELEIETGMQDFPNHFKGALKGLTVRNLGASMYSTRKGYLIVQNNKYVDGFRDIYTTEEEALRVAKEEVVPKLLGIVVEKKQNTAPKFVRPQLKGITRTGEDYRVSMDINGDDMLRAFKFRGGEFGNWNTQADRQAFLNYSYDAFCDLANVLRVPYDFMSLGGYKDKKLAVAFGSRGKGSALAHYESANVVINLTKMKGAGCLAHEWGHALDDYIGIKCGYDGLFTEKATGFRAKTQEYKEVQEAFTDLMDTLKNRHATDDELMELREKNLRTYKKGVERWLSGFETKKVRTKEGYEPLDVESKAKLVLVKEKLLSEMTIDCLAELSAVHKEVTKVLPSKDLRGAIGSYLRQYEYTKNAIEDLKKGVADNRGKRDTKYYAGAKELDKGRKDAYCQSNVELFARAFESYVEDVIVSRGNKSDYLVHSTLCRYYPGLSPYPDGEERKLFNAKMREFLELVVTTFSTLEDEVGVENTEVAIKELTIEEAIKVAKLLSLGRYKALRRVAMSDDWFDRCESRNVIADNLGLCKVMVDEYKREGSLINFPENWGVDEPVEVVVPTIEEPKLEKGAVLNTMSKGISDEDKVIAKQIEDIIGGAFRSYEDVDDGSEVAMTSEPVKVLEDTLVGHFTPDDLVKSCKELDLQSIYKVSPKNKDLSKLVFKDNDVLDYVTVALSVKGTPYKYMVKVVYTNGKFTYLWGNTLGCNGIANFINSKANKILK